MEKPNQRHQQRKISRRKILDAGIELFSLKGFEGTSIAEIAGSAGVKKSLVMHHFTSKEQLWRDCVDDIFARADHFIDHEFGREPAKTLADRKRHLRIWVKACFRFPGYIRIPSIEGTIDNERVRWLAERHIMRSHKYYDKLFKVVSKQARLPYDRIIFSTILTGWVQLLVNNKPLYDHIAGRALVTEKEMLKWSDRLFDLIYIDDPILTEPS